MKRLFDLLLGGVAALVLVLPILVVAFLVRLTSTGPVLYWSDRVGRQNKIFRMPKFRSMRVGTPAVATHLLSDPKVYLTPIGSFLRKSSLDELPQLWSILKGDMSFVGPRALRPNEKEVGGDGRAADLAAFPGYAARHAVRPGLTGLAQVYLPGEAPRRRKFRYDLLYIRRMSFWADLALMALSFGITFRGKWESREPKV